MEYIASVDHLRNLKIFTTFVLEKKKHGKIGVSQKLTIWDEFLRIVGVEVRDLRLFWYRIEVSAQFLLNYRLPGIVLLVLRRNITLRYGYHTRILRPRIIQSYAQFYGPPKYDPKLGQRIILKYSGVV